MVQGLRYSCAAISLLVRPSVTSPAIWEFLRCQLLDRGDVALAHGLSGGPQLGFGPLFPRHRAQPPERLQRGPQGDARVGPPPLSAEPFAVEQFRTRTV